MAERLLRMVSRRGPVAALVTALLVLTGACGKGSSGAAPLSGISAPSKDAAIAAELPSNIKSRGSWTVVSDVEYAPMEFYAPDNKTAEGADIDIAVAVGDVLGLKTNIVNSTFSAIIPGLSSGKYDVSWSSFFDNKERQMVVDMIDYFQAGEGMFSKASNTRNYTSLDQLCGQAVSAEDATVELDDANAAAKKCLSEGKGKMTVLHFPTQNAVNLAVTTGRAVVGLADTEVAEYQVKVTGGKVRFAGEYAPPVLYGIAVPRPAGAAPGTGPLTKPILDALKKLFQDGTYKKILDKWGIATGALSAPGVNMATS